MPLQVPLVDTFGPVQQGLDRMSQIAYDAPFRQMNALRLGEYQRQAKLNEEHDAQNKELTAIVSQVPPEQRTSVAIRYLESKGRFDEAQKIKDFDLQKIGAIAKGNPEAGHRALLEHFGIPYESAPYKPENDLVAVPEGGLASKSSRQIVIPGVQKQTPDEKEAQRLGISLSEYKTKMAGDVAKAQAGARPPNLSDAESYANTMAKAHEQATGQPATDAQKAKWMREYKTASTQISIANRQDQRDFKNESSMRQEFTKLPEVKTFQLIDSQMNRVDKAMKEASIPGTRLLAVDQTLITVLNKMLDPSSVVRESEYARTPGDQALLDSIKGKIAKISSGGAGLTPPERQALVRMINGFYEVAKQQYDEQVSYYTDLASRYGYKPENIVRLGGKLGRDLGGGGFVRMRNPKDGSERLVPADSVPKYKAQGAVVVNE